jgi:hypothetical protein
MATQNYYTIKNAALVTPATVTDLGSVSQPYGNLYLQGNVTLGTTTLTSTNAVAPKISSISYPNSASATVPTGGETLTINGSGFQSGASVYLASALINTSTVANTNAITFTSPVKVDGNYSLVVVNTDGGTATFVPGVTYSDLPVFSTASGTLGNAWEGNTISTSVSATSDSSVSFSITSGALPNGLTLASNGTISGTLANSASGNTTNNFTVTASDQELQKTSRNFSYMVTGDTITWSSPSNNTTYTSYVNSAISNVALSAASTFGRTVTYTANSLPTGLSISGSNITGTPTVVANSSSIISATTTTKQVNIQLNWSIQNSVLVFHGFNTPANPPYNGINIVLQSITVNSSGLFVAVGKEANTNYPVYTKSTDGSNWSLVSRMNNSTNYAVMFSVTVNSSGLFVAVGLGTSNAPLYATSTDGSTWTTPAKMNNSSYGAAMVSVTVNSSGLFVAVGNAAQGADATPLYATSTDGSTWTTPAKMNISNVNAIMLSVTVNSSGLFVAIGRYSNGYPLYATSTNGSTWTTPALMNNSNSEANMNGVTVNSSGLFVAVGYNTNGYPLYATSTNGSTWTTPAIMNNSYTAAYMYSVTVNSSGLFVAVGYGAGSTPLYATSTNGSTWTTPAKMNNSSVSAAMLSVTVNSSGLFAAVGFDNNTYPVYAISN